MRNRAKKKKEPTKDCFVETGESLGTGMNEKTSILVRILKHKLGCSCWIKES